MRLRNRVTRPFACLGAGFLALVLSACGDDGGGSGSADGSGTGTGTISTTSATGYEPDPVECAMNKPCTPDTVAADCCEGVQHPGTLPGITCPSSTYPHNWTCDVFGYCAHGGCTADSDCANLVPGLECMQVGGVGHCVAPCVNDDDCTSDQIMDATKCIGESDIGEDFCLEQTGADTGG